MLNAICELIASRPVFPRFKTVEGQGIPRETGAPSIQGAFPNSQNRVSETGMEVQWGTDEFLAPPKKQVCYYNRGRKINKKPTTK